MAEEIVWKPPSSSQQSNNMAVAVTNQNPLPNVSGNEAKKKEPQNIPVPEECKHKNRLQEFTQRASLGFPRYSTINEGAPHAPLFRTSVLVDGIWYTSPSTFSQLKASEQDAAKVALRSVKERVKHEGCPLVSEDTVFCKSILNEYAVKIKVEAPTYKTDQYAGLLPAFKSTLVFNGIQYTGETGKNKKEAEQLAARAAVKSILETDSAIAMLEIVKSKRKLYAALDKVPDAGHSHAGFMPPELGPAIHVGKRKEVVVVDNAGQKPNIALSANSVGQPSDVQAQNQPLVFKKPKSGLSSVEVASTTHVERGQNVVIDDAKPKSYSGLLSYSMGQPNYFQAPTQHQQQHTLGNLTGGVSGAPTQRLVFEKPNSGSSTVEMAPPIEFVPPVLDPSVPCSTLAKKRRRNKKKAKQIVQVDPQQSGAMSLTQVPPCSVAQ